MDESDVRRIIINPIATPLYICWQHHSFIIDWFWDPIIADKPVFFDELSTMYFTLLHLVKALILDTLTLKL